MFKNVIPCILEEKRISAAPICVLGGPKAVELCSILYLIYIYKRFLYIFKYKGLGQLDILIQSEKNFSKGLHPQGQKLNKMHDKAWGVLQENLQKNL